MNKKLYLLTFFVTFVLFISSCDGGGSGGTEDFPTGFNGVDLSFDILSHRENQKILPKDIFDFEVVLENKGGYDSENGNVVVQAPNVMKGIDSDIKDSIKLPKDDYYRGYLKYEVTGVPGGGTTEKGSLVGRVCYDYKTQLSISACRGNPKPKEECDINGIGTNGERINYGQGAPLSVSKVDERFVPRGEGTVPKFEITLKKHNQEDDVYKKSEDNELCTGKLNEFDYKITFSGGLVYDSREKIIEQDFICNPENPVFTKEDSSGEIIAKLNCELKEEHSSQKEGLAVTPLNVEIFYDYATRESVKLTFGEE